MQLGNGILTQKQRQIIETAEVKFHGDMAGDMTKITL
jgi:hypothetical protein